MTGSGTNEPSGLLDGAPAGLDTPTAAASLAVGDLYAVRQALPARWRANASWLMHPTSADSVFQLVSVADPSNAAIMPAGREGPLLGRPLLEATGMDDAPGAGDPLALYGDLRASYTIVDRGRARPRARTDSYGPA